MHACWRILIPQFSKQFTGFLDSGHDLCPVIHPQKYCCPDTALHTLQLYSIYGDGWLGLFCVWVACTKTSVFLRLIVSPNILEASAKQLTMACKLFSVCAMNTQSSANRASRMTFPVVIVLAERWHGPKTELSEQYLCTCLGRGFSQHGGPV